MAKLVTQQRRTVQRTATRNRRAINLAHNAIPLHRGATENCVLHKHMNGYLLVELNGYKEPVRAWRDCDGIFPIRSGRIDTGRIAEIVTRIRPKTLYINDGEPLQTWFRTGDRTDTRVEPYCGSLTDLLSSVRVTERRPPMPPLDTGRAPTVSFRDVKLLEPNMTLREYRSIYEV